MPLRKERTGPTRCCRRISCYAALAASLTLVAACGATPAATSKPAAKAPAAASTPAAAAPPAAGKKLTALHLRFPWLVGGYDEPFILGAAKGYYKAAGFAVKELQGKGSAIAVETVGNGSDTFGVADAGTTALLISKGAPVKVIAVFNQDSPDSFVSRHAITSPKQLVGRTIVTAAGDANLEMLPAVLHRYGVSMKQVKLDLTSPASIPQLMLKTPHSVMLGFSNSNDLTALKLDRSLVITPYSKFGVNPYGTALITNLTEIKNHPNAVRRFVAASVKSWEAAVKDPAAAVAASAKAFPHASMFELKNGLTETIPTLHTSATKGHPLGWTAASDWQATLKLLEKYGGLKTPKPVSDYYTNSFLPGGSSKTSATTSSGY